MAKRSSLIKSDIISTMRKLATFLIILLFLPLFGAGNKHLRELETANKQEHTIINSNVCRNENILNEFDIFEHLGLYSLTVHSLEGPTIEQQIKNKINDYVEQKLREELKEVYENIIANDKVMFCIYDVLEADENASLTTEAQILQNGEDTGSVFGYDYILRINDNFNSFLAASCEIKSYDLSHVKQGEKITRETYISHTLLVITNNINIDIYGADKALISTTFHCELYFSSVTEAQFAYEQYSKRNDVKAVQFNSLVATADDLEKAESEVTMFPKALGSDGIYEQNDVAKNAISFTTGYGFLEKIKNVFGEKNNDVVAVLDAGFNVGAGFVNGTTIVGAKDITDNDTNLYSPYVNLGKNISQHGTHVAGIVAQFSKGCKIMPVKVFDDAGYSWDKDTVSGIEAVLQYNQTLPSGQRVVAVNMSYGGTGNMSVAQVKIDELYNEDIIAVISAGNESANARCVSS